MTWIDFVWPMMGSASLTLGLVHLLIWPRQRERPAHLVFFFCAAAVGVLAIFELLGMRTESPERYGLLLRWAHLPIAVLIIGVIAYVRLRFHAGRQWLAFLIAGLRIGLLIANFNSEVNVNFDRITALQRVELWGEIVSVPIGVPNRWALLALLSNVLLIGFLLDAIAQIARRPRGDERRRALAVVGAMALFLLTANGATMMVTWDIVHLPLTVNPAFLCVLVVMSYELGGDVVRGALLARRLELSESHLRESEGRMAMAAGAGGLGFWTWDVAKDRVWANDSARALFGFDPTVPIDFDDFFRRLHPDDRTDVRQGLEQSLEHGREFERDFRIVLPDGGVRWIASRGRVEASDSDGTPLLRGVSFDLTARKQAEDRFRIAVEAAPNATLMLDPDGQITLANAQAERVFGYSREELLALKAEALIPERLRGAHADLRAGYSAAPSARAAGAGRELFGLRKDGSEVPVEISLNPIQTDQGTFVLASISDITQRLQGEKEAALHRAELAHLSRVAMLGELSGSLAHELNQPLAAVLSNAQAALRFLNGGPEQLEEVRDCLVDIVDNDKRAGDVIRRLRALLKKEDVEFRPLDLNEVVVDVLRLTRSDLLNRNVSVATKLAPELPPVLGDRVQLQQVLLNLVMNACDAMEALPHGRRIEVRTNGHDGGQVEVVVSDVGKGIAQDQLERIFEPFVTNKAEGMGMGLAVCRTIVKSHGGSLSADNNPVRGATFRFALPAATSS